MKSTEIVARHIYTNRGAGNTLRFVLDIGEFRPLHWYSHGPRPIEPGVLYRDNRGKEGVLYLSSFAKWAGKCVGYENGDGWTITDDINHSLLEQLS